MHARIGPFRWRTVKRVSGCWAAWPLQLRPVAPGHVRARFVPCMAQRAEQQRGPKPAADLMQAGRQAVRGVHSTNGAVRGQRSAHGCPCTHKPGRWVGRLLPDGHGTAPAPAGGRCTHLQSSSC